MDYSRFKMLVFDLDGTLLNSEKCISENTAQAILRCQHKGIKIAVCTSRSEINSLAFIDRINPDAIISSGGALVKADGKYIAKHEFAIEETKDIISRIRKLLGRECEITIDTVHAHFWNYKINPKLTEANWGDSIYSDFENFCYPSLKICVEILDNGKVSAFYDCFHEYDCVHFTDGNWHKITKKNITKENAIRDIVTYYGCNLKEIMAFGDDLADIGMLKMSGLGVAMENAVQKVKDIADIVIGSNDNDGIADFLEIVFATVL